MLVSPEANHQHRIQWQGREGQETWNLCGHSHLFYDLFVQGWGGPWPPRHRPPGSATESLSWSCYFFKFYFSQQDWDCRRQRKICLSITINKEASWLYAELKSHISFQVTFVAYLKLSDETWNEICYLKLLKLFKPYHRELLTWNFQMRLEMRCAIRNFWNLSKLSWRVAYLKLSDETWNEMCY